MRSYEILSHTADARILVNADTLAELFAAALEGMNELLKEGFCEKASEAEIEKSISLSTPDETSLLVDFLSEVLTASHEEKAVFCEVKSMAVEPSLLRVTLGGSKVDKFGRDVKSVTYYEAEVKKNKEGNYETQIVFDI